MSNYLVYSLENALTVYAVFLSYYPDKGGEVAKKFIKDAKFLAGDKEFISIIVNNSGKPIEIESIVGDNSAWEFSGFQSGINHLKSKYVLKSTDIVIFANDTYRRHRRFNILDLLSYKKAIFKNKYSSFPILIGERFNLTAKAIISELPFTGWVSTYFFVTNGALLEHVNKLDNFSCNTKLRLVDNKITFNEIVDENLASHINKWLCPVDNTFGWYNANSASKELILGKAKAILNEKYLSALCENNNGQKIHVYEGLLGKLTRLINYRLFPSHKARVK